jgi:renalase
LANFDKYLKRQMFAAIQKNSPRSALPSSLATGAPKVFPMDCEVMIVGAGLCGLHAAARLKAAGRSVLVLEKSRGLGGRAATRRWNNLPVDHGAQFFTAKNPAFAEQVKRWEKAGTCHEWTRGFHRFAEGKLHDPAEDSHPRYACRAGMSSLGRALGEPLGDIIHREAKLIRLGVVNGLWQATLEDGRLVHARSLLLTPPPPQSGALLADSAPEVSAEIAQHRSLPCLAVGARFSRAELPWQGIQAPDDALLTWIGHDTSKRPELHPDCTILMLHASPDFSTANASAPEAEVTAALLRLASEMTSRDWMVPTGVFLQRWRYALPAPGGAPRGPAVYSTPAPLVVAGDWCAGGRIEGAWLTGRDAADQLLGLLS